MTSQRLNRTVEDNDAVKRSLLEARHEVQLIKEQLNDATIEKEELINDLKAERQHAVELTRENVTLREGLDKMNKRMKTEEEGFFMLTQNDILNKKLLQSFMENFDQVVGPTA